MARGILSHGPLRRARRGPRGCRAPLLWHRGPGWSRLGRRTFPIREKLLIHRDPTSSLEQDHRSGASELLTVAAAAARAALEDTGPDPDRLLAAFRRLCRAQPAMGAVVRLVSRALAVAESGRRAGTPDETLAGEVSQAIEAFVADFDTASRALVTHGLELIPPGGWIATYSRSSLVERVLAATARQGRPLRVLLAESRPRLEGRELARRLAALEVPCWFTVDASAALLLPQAGAVLVGADAVQPRAFVNKAGTYPLLLAAREQGVPAYALAQRAKFLPEDASLLELGERDPVEVWEDPPAGVSVRNLNFEQVPLALVRGVVTEDGVLPPGEAGAACSQVEIPEGLKAPWGRFPEEEDDD